MASSLRDPKIESALRTAKMEGELRSELRKKLKPVPTAPATSHLSAATTLLEKRREMFEVQTALDAQKAEYQRFEEILKRREGELEAKDLKLQDALVKFNKHLQEHDHKRQRADQKWASERQARQQKEGEIEEERKKLVNVRQQLVELKSKRERERIYPAYLEQVVGVEGPGEYFQTVDAIISRYKALKHTHRENEQHQAELTKAIHDQRVALKQLETKEEAEMLRANNTLFNLRTRAELCGLDTAKIEREVEDNLHFVRDKKKDYARVLLALSHLYKRVLEVSQINRASVPLSNPEEVYLNLDRVLTTIADFLSDARYTLTVARPV